MLVIRMQRTGRKGHAQFRVVVQDSRRTPTSGRIVAQIGHFNPHSKEVVLDKEKAQTYLNNGAQPTDRIARLLKAEGIKLPSWVKLEGSKVRAIRNPDKLRKNRPAEPMAEETPVEEPVTEVEAPAEVAESDEPKAQEPATDKTSEAQEA